MCVTLIVIPDYQGCTRPITTNPGSMESGVYGLTRRTCSIACRFDCTRSPGFCGFLGVFWVGRIFPCFFYDFVFFERTRPAASMRPLCHRYLSTGRETTRTTCDTSYGYQVPGIYSKQLFAAGTPVVLLYEKSDAVRIEPRPPSPNTCRLCAHSSQTFIRPQANGDGTRMQGVLGESRQRTIVSALC